MGFFVLLFVCSPSLHYLSRTSGRWTTLHLFLLFNILMTTGDIKEILQKCIKQDIVNDWHFLRALIFKTSKNIKNNITEFLFRLIGSI